MKVVSFFAGCGGLDLGFTQAGFDVIWANEFDVSILETYKINHPNTYLCNSNIKDIDVIDIPDCDGFIGGPPCQAWSEAGRGLGLEDERGMVFFDYIRLIKGKQPKFFLIENVKGIINEKNEPVFQTFIYLLQKAGYNINYTLLDAINYRIPQNRERIFIIGIRKDLNYQYNFPCVTICKQLTLKDAISDIKSTPNIYYNDSIINTSNTTKSTVFNHDVFGGRYSKRYMSRNRVRSWNEPSFTIPASAQNVPLHPQAPKMEFISYEEREFRKGMENLYRRLSVRECARIQTFPDSFRFIYTSILDGYKMIGNAVPPRLAKVLALSIKTTFNKSNILLAYIKDDNHLFHIRLNKLYYIRKNYNGNNLNLNNIDYLLLHDSKKMYLFSVINNSIKECNASYLKDKGFSPSVNNYWTFNILAELDISNVIISLDKNYIFSSKRPRNIQAEIRFNC